MSDEPTATPTRDRIIERATPAHYANWLNVAGSLSDCEITLGVQTRDDDGEVATQRVASVLLPWSLVSWLSATLAEQVAMYERRHGPISGKPPMVE